jgi:hypothetical protein
LLAAVAVNHLLLKAAELDFDPGILETPDQIQMTTHRARIVLGPVISQGREIVNRLYNCLLSDDM